LSLNQAAAIVGGLTGHPGAIYRQISAEEARAQLLSFGFSRHMADSIVQMTEDVNRQRIHMAQPREERIITSTRFETFAKGVLSNSNAGRAGTNHPLLGH
jgi:hypothetical protein